MKCPKCQNEIIGNAKFCTKCGCNLAEVMANEKQVMKPVCVKCGAELMPGAKFCTKCGTPTASAAPSAPAESTPVTLAKPATPVTPTATAAPSAPTPVTPSAPIAASTPVTSTPVTPAAPIAASTATAPKAVTPVTPAAPIAASAPAPMASAPYQNGFQPAPERANNVPTEQTGKKKAKKEKAPKQPKEQEKAGAGLIVAAVILGVLVVASGVVCFLVWNGTIALPTGDKTVTVEVTEEETESTSEEDTSDVSVDVNVDELFAEEDELLTTAKSQIAVDAEIVNGMNNLEAVINQSVAKAEEAGDANLAADRVTDAYLSYVTAVSKHKDMLDGSTLSGGIYGQVMMELEDAIALGDELTSKGYTVDTASLVSTKDEFDKAYTDKIIDTFDEFTSREAWSRTESWNLMSETADNMFDPSDLDNPIRLRYAYALSWWTQKQIETELANGTITAKGAAIKIANLIDVMDYNPMMINYYIDYMHEAGEDCAEVEDAYEDIVEQIAQTQGLTIGEDVPLDHFWYFNDFVTHSVDSTNGVTQENREWIRDRMSSVTFLKQ